MLRLAERQVTVSENYVGDSSFGNGRGVRNLYEKTLVNQANRLAQKDYSVSDLMKLLPEDLPADY